jgi:YesN/AraC family two-component response regulator
MPAENPGMRVHDLARELDRHPSWLGAAYRQAVGEGILETAARPRVERAARLLRERLPSTVRVEKSAFSGDDIMRRRAKWPAPGCAC